MVRQNIESLSPKSDSLSAYEIAIKEAIAERATIAIERGKVQDKITALDTRDAELAALIKMLIALLPNDRQAAYEVDQANISGRASETFGAVVQLIPKAREWTAPKMQSALAAKGLEPEPKQLHNIFNYLARSGRLRRVSRGRYLYMGVMFETSDEMPEMDEPTRFTE